MILLNSALCSKDFRKVGIIHSAISLTSQIIVVLIVCVFLVNAANANGRRYNNNCSITSDGAMWMCEPSASEMSNNVSWTGIFSAFVFLGVVDIVIYSLLIYGLVKRKPRLLSLWLSFAPLEVVTLEVFLIYGFSAITISAPTGIGIIFSIIFILIGSYMFHNICIVFSARHGFIRDEESQNRNLGYQLVNTTASEPNSLPTSYQQCNHPQHFEYNAQINQYIPCKCIYPHLAPNHQETEIQRSDSNALLVI